MLILGVDPGLTTGYVKYDTEHKIAQGQHYVDPVRVGKAIEHDARAYFERDPIVVIESLVGAGPRLKETNHTLQVLGFARWYAETLGLQVVLQAPQQRLPYVAQATLMCPGMKHAQAALAHCLAYATKQGTFVPYKRTNDIDSASMSR